jgi:ATP-dependent 26S proteasome regulatory subunit
METFFPVKKNTEIHLLDFDSSEIFNKSQKTPLRVESNGLTDAINSQTSALQGILTQTIGGSGSTDQLLPSDVRDVLKTLKNPRDFKSVTFDSIVGNEDAKSIFRTEVLLPIKAKKSGVLDLSIYENNRGILFFGSPGNGKTIFVHAIATELVKLYKEIGLSENDVSF